MKRFITTLRIASALVLSLFSTSLLPTTVALATQPDGVGRPEAVSVNDNCKDLVTEGSGGWGVKIDTEGDPETVTVYADPGMLIDKYCVKAGSGDNSAYIQIVNPPSATVVIDHNVKNSVSHYVVHQIPAPVASAPQATALLVPCVAESGLNDKVSVSVTNTDDDTDAAVTYTIVLGGQTKNLELADGATGNVEFGDLTVGSYTATVTGTDGTVTTNSVTVKTCTVTPPPRERADYNLTSLCKPSPTQGQFRITNNSDAAEAYSLALFGSNAAPFTGTVAANSTATVIVPWNSSSETWKLTIAGFEYTKAVGDNQLCQPTPPVTEGALVVATDCEELTFSSANVKPSEAIVTFKVNGETRQPGVYNLTAGDYTIELFVNEKLVDTETVTIQECENPETLFAVVTVPCVVPGANGMFDVSVSNPNTANDVDFELRLINESGIVATKQFVVNAGSQGMVTISDVPVGDYSLELWASSGNYVYEDKLGTTNVSLINCSVGQVLGTSTTTTKTSTPQTLGTSLPAQLPATGPESNLNMVYAIFAMVATYGAVYFLQGRRQIEA